MASLLACLWTSWEVIMIAKVWVHLSKAGYQCVRGSQRDTERNVWRFYVRSNSVRNVMLADSSRLDQQRDSVLSKIKSKDKRENRIHNHRRPFLTLLYIGDRPVSAKQWPLSRWKYKKKCPWTKKKWKSFITWLLLLKTKVDWSGFIWIRFA